MALKVYQFRLKEQKPSLWRRTAKTVRELPTGTKILTGVAVIAGGAALLPVEIPLLLGGAVVTSGSALLAAGAVTIFGGSDEKVHLIESLEEAGKFKPHSGEPLDNGYFYVAHPKKPNVLLIPSLLHREIVKEQVNEIIHYLRSRLLVTRLRIDVKSAIDRKLSMKGVQVETGLSFSESHGLSVESVYDSPELVPMATDPVWLFSTFPTIVSSVKGATSGTSTIHESQDMDFGLSAGLCQRIGIDARWTTTQTFTVSVEYGSVGSPKALPAPARSVL